MLWTFTNNLFLQDKNTSNEYKYIGSCKCMFSLSCITAGWRKRVVTDNLWTRLSLHITGFVFNEMRYTSSVENILCQTRIWVNVKECKRHWTKQNVLWFEEVNCERIYQHHGYLPSVFSKYSLSSMASFLVLPTCVKLKLSIYRLLCSMSKMRCAAIRNKTQSPANMRNIETIPRKLLKDIFMLSDSYFHNAGYCSYLR